MSEEWFQSWFQKDYFELYGQFRSDDQASLQVQRLLHQPELQDLFASNKSSPHRILDACCGSGRHTRALLKYSENQPDIRCYSFDLSAYLLEKIPQEQRQGCVRADMRKLPFLPQSFSLVCSFFTSFGYFDTAQEDVAVMQGYADLLCQNGFLFLDFLNRDFVLSTLVPEDEKLDGSRRILQKRRFDGEFIRKQILIEEEGLETREYQERVRAWSRADLESVFHGLGLRVVRCFGDEELGEYDPIASPRLSFLLKK